jgi:putative exosortase-associated protein (TIGR04073 family)
MNAAFGWTEIPKRIVDITKESNPIKGVLLGSFQGACRAFARTASGVSELVTFPIGRYDKPHVLPDMPAAK